MNKKQYTIGCLMLLVVSISVFLIIETAGFYFQIFPEQGVYKAFAAGTLLEISAVFLILWRPVLKEVKIFKYLIILSFFITIVFSASLYSIQPILAKSNISAFDLTKIKSFELQIERQSAALEAVKGQQMNAALAARRLSELQAELVEAYRSAESNPNALINAGIDKFKIALLISVRCLLQFANWLFAHLILTLIVKDKTQENQLFENFDKSQKSQNLSKKPSESSELSEKEKKIVDFLKRRDGAALRPAVQAAVKLPELDDCLRQLTEKNIIVIKSNGKKTGEEYRLLL